MTYNCIVCGNRHGGYAEGLEPFICDRCYLSGKLNIGNYADKAKVELAKMVKAETPA